MIFGQVLLVPKTPLRYNLEYRTFIYLTSGKAKLKLIPPHSSRYLNVEKDYDNFEFRSAIILGMFNNNIKQILIK